MGSDYTCYHLDSDQVGVERARTLLNPYLKHIASRCEDDQAILRYHQQLPGYGVTALHALPTVAKELGFAHVFLKDESNRFGLPSFKSAGASWALYRTLCRHLQLQPDVSEDQLKQAVREDGNVHIVTCTEGNWGRAVAKFAKHFGVAAKVFVPGAVNAYTQDLIRREGADVTALQGKDYDECLAVALDDSEQTGAFLILDIALGHRTEAPQWVTEGYSTILNEVDEQLYQEIGRKHPDIVIGSVGCGSWMEAIVKHFKGNDHDSTVVAVEPDTAASFKESLHVGKITAIRTAHTIMNGMNCGTTSSSAWPSLRDAVDIATTVTDAESHACVQELRSMNINSGPCGAANLAALRHICTDTDQEDRSNKVVVLFSSEGWREYAVPA